MSVKNFLKQVQRIDRRISSKTEQVKVLRSLAADAGTIIDKNFVKKSGDKQRMEAIIVKIVDLENEIKKDLQEFLDLKQRAVSLIKILENSDYQVILELRYLCSKTWEEISEITHFSPQHVYRLHYKALSTLENLV